MQSRFWYVARMCSRGVEIGVSHLKETPIQGPICLIWTFV